MNNKIYFPGLNGLRFFSALLVIITHIELIKFKLKLPNFLNINFIDTVLFTEKDRNNGMELINLLIKF